MSRVASTARAAIERALRVLCALPAFRAAHALRALGVRAQLLALRAMLSLRTLCALVRWFMGLSNILRKSSFALFGPKIVFRDVPTFLTIRKCSFLHGDSCGPS